MSGPRDGLTRRALLGAALAPMAACTPPVDALPPGGWVGAQVERGHRMRDLGAASGSSAASAASMSGSSGASGVSRLSTESTTSHPSKSGISPPPALTRHCGVVVVGAGISGLGAARALAASGIDDVQVFDLEDAAGGNSRGHLMGGLHCPLGAHYLPVPGGQAVEVAELLESLGLSRRVHGRTVFDERHLCHSPQERLFIDGHWREGLLPPLDALPVAERMHTLDQYRRFSVAVAATGDGGAFAIPTSRSNWSPALDALDRVTFTEWLAAHRFDAPALLWYLDYCCRDDYGAGSPQVSAWAGLHYFASRHGFRAPGSADEGRAGDASEGVLTWPEGNAWLSTRMAAPLGTRLHTGHLALRVDESRHGVDVDFWNVGANRVERWSAPQVVLALPLFIAVRLLVSPGAALVEAASMLRHSPWLVANVHLDAPLDDAPGAPPSWDNVVYGSPALGYVDATHQSLMPYAGATVLTAYWALGGDSPAQLAAARARLLADPWSRWSDRVFADLARPHPDLRRRATRIDLMRYGHAMAIPSPGVRSSAALRALATPQRRVHFAHSDLSAYSVFEEALQHGCRAAADAVAAD